MPICRNDQRQILERVERELVGTRGVVRYAGDAYNTCHAGPPEWTMGFGFLALGWNAVGERDRAVWYWRRLESLATPEGELPEAWCHEPTCDRYFNSPLCWSQALYVVASIELGLESNATAPARLSARALERAS